MAALQSIHEAVSGAGCMVSGRGSEVEESDSLSTVAPRISVPSLSDRRLSSPPTHDSPLTAHLRLFMILLLTGCSTHATRLREAREAYFLGDLTRATTSLESAGSLLARDGDCLQLDRAMVALAQGDAAQAERLLREVRDRFDYLEQKDLAESGVALLTDDTHTAYAGEDYEKVLIRAMLAVSNLMRDGSDAVPYSLQVDQKQQEIIERGVPGAAENPKLAYKQVALGAYLRGVIQEETHRDYDDAERAFATVAAWEPRFMLARYDAERARAGVHSSPGNGVVYVFTLVGRGPYKEEEVAEVTSDVMLVADRIISAVGDHSLPPTIAPIKVPCVVVPSNFIDSVAVDVNGRPTGLTQTVTDVGELAIGEWQATRKHKLARAVVRRSLKKAAIYGTKDALQIDNIWTNLAFDAAGVVWEATESADTRCWGLLPAKIQVLRIELPVGPHELALRAARAGRPIGAPSLTSVDVIDGRNTYVLASFPGPRMVGEVLVSQQGALTVAANTPTVEHR